jgi:hypothetical protein
MWDRRALALAEFGEADRDGGLVGEQVFELRPKRSIVSATPDDRVDHLVQHGRPNGMV